MSYRCEAKSRDAFVAQLVRYVSSGHYFYLTGVIPEQKDPRRIDAKLLGLYDIDRPKWKRQRRYLKKLAGIHYLRHQRFWVIILTKGEHHAIYRDHGGKLLDIRRTALKFRGYSIRYSYSQAEKRERVFVRLDKASYRLLRNQFLELAVRARYASPARCEAELRERMLRWQAYAPVREQFVWMIRAVNRLRRRAGYRPISYACIPEVVRVKRVFVDDDGEGCLEAA